MSRKRDLNFVPLGLREFLQCESHLFAQHMNKIRVVVEDSQLIDMESCHLRLLQGRRDVFSILPTSGITAETRSDIGDRSLHTIAFHLKHRVVQKRLPVPVSPVDGQGNLVSIQFCSQELNEISTLLIDRADTAKVVVMLGNFQQAFARNGFATEYIFEERNDVVRLFGTTEGKNQNRIVRSC